MATQIQCQTGPKVTPIKLRVQKRGKGSRKDDNLIAVILNPARPEIKEIAERIANDKVLEQDVNKESIQVVKETEKNSEQKQAESEVFRIEEESQESESSKPDSSSSSPTSSRSTSATKQDTPPKVKELCKALKEDFGLELNGEAIAVPESLVEEKKELPEANIRNANDVLMEAKSPIREKQRKGRAKKRKPKKQAQGGSPPKTEKVNDKVDSKHLLTDYYPVRRSYRVPASELKKQQHEEVERAILSKRIDGLKVEDIPIKGRGVIAQKHFQKGDFVVEYEGDLIDLDTAKQRDQDYTEKTDVGCYMYYFKFRSKAYCIDATAESGKLGRLLNHSKLDPNCCTKVVGIRNQPHLIIIAAKDITPGDELVYDYGDRDKETLAANPWLAC